MTSTTAGHETWTARVRSLGAWLLILTPFVGYLSTVALYVVNVPFWDDFLSLLDPLNRMVGASATLPLLSREDGAPLVVLFEPHGPHLFVVQRLIVLLQAALGGADFRLFIWLANLGWAIAAAALMLHLYRTKNVPLWWLAPIPYLMLSTTHWESMDFATESFQYYWGGGLFAVLAIIAAARGYGLAAGILSGLSFLSFGGAPALFPVVGLTLLAARRWRPVATFLLSIGVLAIFYLYYHGLPSSPEMDASDMTFGARLGVLYSDPLAALRYVLIFMGNYFSTGEYALERFNTLFLYAGAVVCVAAIVMIWKARGNVREVLVPVVLFVYVLELSFMAALVRINLPMVPRYSLHALLAAAAVYGGYVVLAARARRSVWVTACIGTTVAASVVYWAATLYVTLPLFALNRDQRLTSLARYAAEGNPDALGSLAPEQTLGDSILRRSRALGIYDFMRVEHTAAAPTTAAAPMEPPQPPEAVAVDDPIPWTSLTPKQQLVLSVGEPVWSTIPADERRAMMNMADRWEQTEAVDQWKMLNALRDRAGLPHVGPDADREGAR